MGKNNHLKKVKVQREKLFVTLEAFRIAVTITLSLTLAKIQ